MARYDVPTSDPQTQLSDQPLTPLTGADLSPELFRIILERLNEQPPVRKVGRMEKMFPGLVRAHRETYHPEDVAAEQGYAMRQRELPGLISGYSQLQGTQARMAQAQAGKPAWLDTTDDAGNPIRVPGRQMPDGTFVPAGQVFPTKVSNVYVPTLGGIQVEPRYGQPNADYLRTPGGQTAFPPIPPGIGEQAVKQRTLRSIAESARDASISYAQNASAAQRIGVQTAGSMPLVGGMARTLTGYMDPEAELTNTAIGRVSDSLLRLKSGAQINESEYQRLAVLVPRIGDAPEVIAGKWMQFFAELSTIESTRGALYPAIEQALPANMVSPGANIPGRQGPFSGKNMTRQQFDQLRPDEQQRWLSGGGTVQ